MIIEGVKLSILGMGVVFIFLVLLIISIIISGRLLKSSTEREIELEQSHSPAEDKGKLVAIISAAIKKHRNKK